MGNSDKTLIQAINDALDAVDGEAPMSDAEAIEYDAEYGYFDTPLEDDQA